VGPPGTEFIMVCARPGRRVLRDEVASLFPPGNPWPALPRSSVIWLDREKTTLNDKFAGDSKNTSRGPGTFSASAARDALKPIEEARERLRSKAPYVLGVAFAHGAAEDPLADSAASVGSSRSMRSASRSVTP
jgi:hypothetical protein